MTGVGSVVDECRGQRCSQPVPLAVAAEHGVAAAFEHLEIEVETVADRAGEPGFGGLLRHDAVLAAVDQSNRNGEQLAQRFVRRQPGGQPDHPDDTRRIGDAQCGAGAHRVADERDRPPGEAGGQPVERPAEVVHRCCACAVPAAGRELQAEHRQRPVVTCDSGRDRANPQRGELPPADRRVAGRTSAVDDQDDATRRVRYGDRYQVGMLVGTKSGYSHGR